MENIFNYAMGGIVDSLEVYIIFRYMMIFFEDAYVNDRLAYIAYAARLFISLALRFASVSPVISAGISYGITRPFTDPATQATWSRLKDEMRDWLARA